VIRKVGVILLGVAVCLLGTTSALAMKYNESPMLKTKVAAGLLPPVEERLPEEPYVMQVREEIGQYGGTLTTIRPAPERYIDTSFYNNETLLDYPLKLILPRVYKGNVLESCEVNEDATVFTLHLRKGMKWSDGYPLTSEDFLFRYEDVLLNDKLTPIKPLNLMAGGELMKLEAIDDYTIRITFSEPYGGFPSWLGSWLNNYTFLVMPKHYLKQFHPRYTPMEKLETLIKKEGYGKGEWWRLFNKKWAGEVIGKPTLSPWIVVKKQAGKFVYERNPYYWKVDSKGNQLPYTDRLVSTLVTSVEMGTMKMIAGEVNACFEMVQLRDYPLLKENEEKGGYRVQLQKGFPNWVLVLNETNEDPVWRQVVRDIRFRKALALAINYEEMNDALALGVGSLTELSPSVYDPEKANQLLDEMGMDKRDAEGWRLGPDGKRFTIPFEVSQVWGFETKAAELLREYFRTIGIHTTVKTVEFSYWDQIGANNTIKASVHWTGVPYWKTSIGAVAWPEYLPDRYRSWGPAWRTWYDTNGEAGEEPPKKVKRLFELRDIVVSTPSEEERAKAVDEVLRLHRENLWMIGLIWPSRAAVYGKNLRNTPEPGATEDEVWLKAEQYFFKQ